MANQTPKEIEEQIHDLLKELESAGKKKERDAAKARIACAAVEALPDTPTPGLKEVAGERFDWPLMVSLNRRIGTRKPDIKGVLRGLGLGESTGIKLQGSSWEWNERTRLIVSYVVDFQKARRRLRGKPSNDFYSDVDDEHRCVMEWHIRRLPDFGFDSWEPWLDAIMLDLLVQAGVGENAMALNTGIKEAKLQRAAVKFDKELLAQGIPEEDCVLLKSAIREPLKKAIKSIAGARRV